MSERLSQWTEHDIEVNGITLHYYRTGGEHLPLLLLAHGFSDNGLCFQRTIEQLASDFDVVAFDARNHGLSSRAAANGDAMAADLTALITVLSAEREANETYLLGHSMGGSTAAAVIAQNPDLVVKAILDDPAWTLAGEVAKTKEQKEVDAQKQFKGFKRYLSMLNDMSNDDLLVYAKKEYPDWHADDLPAWVDSKRQIDEGAISGLELTGWRDIALGIQTPTLLIHSEGKRDGLVTPELARELCAKNEHLSAAEISHAGHNIRRENFDDYIKAVRSFFLS